MRLTPFLILLLAVGGVAGLTVEPDLAVAWQASDIPAPAKKARANRAAAA